MVKKPINKIRYPFLEGSFPENPLPFKKLNRKAFRALKDLYKKGLTNRIKRVENRIVKRENSLYASKGFREKQEKTIVTVDNPRIREFFIKSKNQQKKEIFLELTKKKILEKKRYTCKYIFSIFQLFASFYKKQSKYRKSSVFKNLLEERKKLSIVYGCLGEKQIQKLGLQAKKYNGNFDENLIKILERRLDVALFRVCFFPTIISAKQWINHKHVYVNKKIVDLPGYQLKAGDIITIAPEKNLVLKNHISKTLAEKIRIRSFHFNYPLDSFYSLVKNVYSNLFYNKKDYKNTAYKIKQNKKILRIHKIYKSLSILPKVFRNRFIWSFLKLKNLFTTARPLTQRAKSLRISSMKPLNLEVCYKNMVAVFLYSPQKVAVPTSVNLRAIMKGIQ